MTLAPPQTPGRFVTFEGGEGAGKSTQIRRLAQRLAQRGVEVVSTREPGGTPHAERLRELLLSGRAKALGALGEATLFAAARIDHVERLIRPALESGAFVLCDRFLDSTRAYQGAMGKADPRALALLEEVAVGAARPDLTFVLDLPVAEGLARAARRRGRAGDSADRFESEDVAFHEGLRTAFLDIAQREPGRCVVVSSTRPEEDVANEIWRVVESRLLVAAEAQHT
jgi:dTMP kinase